METTTNSKRHCVYTWSLDEKKITNTCISSEPFYDYNKNKWQLLIKYNEYDTFEHMDVYLETPDNAESICTKVDFSILDINKESIFSDKIYHYFAPKGDRKGLAKFIMKDFLYSMRERIFPNDIILIQCDIFFMPTFSHTWYLKEKDIKNEDAKTVFIYDEETNNNWVLTSKYFNGYLGVFLDLENEDITVSTHVTFSLLDVDKNSKNSICFHHTFTPENTEERGFSRFVNKQLLISDDYKVLQKGKIPVNCQIVVIKSL